MFFVANGGIMDRNGGLLPIPIGLKLAYPTQIKFKASEKIAQRNNDAALAIYNDYRELRSTEWAADNPGYDHTTNIYPPLDWASVSSIHYRYKKSD